MNKNVKINMPGAVRGIIAGLNEHGYEAYAVGGCVRDSILGRKPKDWDITTSAKPEQVKKLFGRTIDTGIQHGTVTVVVKGAGYEVTTYRLDGRYKDGRHPEDVTFTASLEEDLKRRDFTINAMAYNEERGIVDCFGGVEDLERGVIKCVGDAKERFGEDALRMLRALRFAAELDFEISQETEDAIQTLAQTITKISRERIQTELDKLLLSDHPDKILPLYSTGLFYWIFGRDGHCAGLSELLMASPAERYVRWALFISYMAPNAEAGGRMLKSLKFDNATVNICSRMAAYKAEPLSPDEADLREQIVKIGKDIFGQYYMPYRIALDSRDTALTENYREVMRTYRTVTERGDCLSINELAVNGRDLEQIGIRPGRKMGAVLNGLLHIVLKDRMKNERETLLAAAGELAAEETPPYSK